ncbi:hypothetical protein M1349_01900 [Patescibacteria group bacterium]|nr:hypothetical protein [Patescibacteria group bacterium]
MNINEVERKPQNKSNLWNAQISRRSLLKAVGFGAGVLFVGEITGCDRVQSIGHPEDLAEKIGDLLNKDRIPELFRYSRVAFIRESENGTELKIRKASIVGITTDQEKAVLIDWKEIESIQSDKKSKPVGIEKEFTLENVEFVDGFDVDEGESTGGKWAQVIVNRKDGKQVWGYISVSKFTKETVILDPSGHIVKKSK